MFTFFRNFFSKKTENPESDISSESGISYANYSPTIHVQEILRKKNKDIKLDRPPAFIKVIERQQIANKQTLFEQKI